MTSTPLRRYGIFLASTLLCTLPFLAHAQTQSQDQLRATIKAELMADPRTQNLSHAQIQSMVDVLTSQAQKQGVTAGQLLYRPAAPAAQTDNAQLQSSAGACSNLMCAFSHAFGLDGSAPWLLGGLFVCAVLLIFLYSKLREMGHPHFQPPGSVPPAPTA